MLKVNLGCGHNLVADYVNVDKYVACNPDIVCDLENESWPFNDGSADFVELHHSLEHMGETVHQFQHVIKELYRVCINGAEVKITLPFVRSEGFISDPTHVRALTPSAFTLFSKKLNAEWKEKGWPNTPLGLYWDVNFEIKSIDIKLNSNWLKKVQECLITEEEFSFAIEHHFNVIEEFTVLLTVIK